MSHFLEKLSPDVSAIADLFLRVAAKKGLSLEEYRVGNFISEELQDSDVTIWDDSAAREEGALIGNKIIVPNEASLSRPNIILCAHMDTVRDTSLCEPVIEHDRIRSDGKHQLGVDNRLGVAILLHILKSRKRLSFNANFIVVFTIDEETTMLGSKGLYLPQVNIDKAIIFDSSKRPGNYVKECAGMFVFNVDFIGKSAHSAVNPEDGISAITAAAHAISNMTFGKLTDEITTNIGKISGGDATNVVTPKVSITGEVRAMDKKTISEILARYESEFKQFVEEKGAQIEFSSHQDFAPYSLETTPEIIEFVENAIKGAGLTPTPLRYTGGSDANVFNDKGIPSANIGIGAQNPHSDNEFVLFEDIENVWKIACNMLT